MKSEGCDPYLVEKYENNSSFKEEVDENYKKYCIIVQQAYYIDLS